MFTQKREIIERPFAYIGVKPKEVQTIATADHDTLIVQARYDFDWQEWRIRLLRFVPGTESGYNVERELVTDTGADIMGVAIFMLTNA